MTGIATSSVMALSALTPAAMFGYVSVEKFAKKISSQIQVANAVFLSLTGNLRPFEGAKALSAPANGAVGLMF